MQHTMGQRSSAKMVLLASLCAGILSACSDSPTEQLASAQKFLEKNDVNAASIELKNALQTDPKLAEARYLLGTVNLRQGDAAGAVKELRRASEYGVPALRVSPVLARALIRQGEVDQVLKEFDGVRLGEPAADAQVLAAVGEAHLSKGNVDRAQEAFNAALEASPAELAARVGIGRVKFTKGDLDGALADADAVLAGQSPGNLVADANALRAAVFLARNKHDDAVAALDAAVKAQPDSVGYHFALVSQLLQKDDIDAAASRLAGMQKIAANNPLTRYLQADIDFRKGNVESARDNIDESTRLAPEHLPGRYLAGLIHARLSEFVIAQEHLNAVLAKASGHKGARVALARVQLALNEADTAQETIRPLLNDKAVDAETMRLAGQIYVATGKVDEASRKFASVVAFNPDDAKARTQLGLSKLLSGKGEAGLDDLEAAAQLDSDEGDADIALIFAYLGRGQIDRAQSALAELEKKHGDDPKTFVIKGAILMARKDSAGARTAFEKAAALKADYFPAVANLARLDIGEKRPQDAVKRLESFIEKNPSVVPPYLMLGGLLARTGAKPDAVRDVLERGNRANPAAVAPRLALIEFELAQREVKKAVTMATETAAAHPNEGRVFGMLGRAQLAGGDREQAVAAFAKQADLMPRAPAPLLELADVQRFMKDNSGAEQALRRALALKPDLLEAQQRLISLYVAEKRFADGVALSRVVQKQRPKASTGWIFEGDIQIVNKAFEAAAQAYRKAYEIDKAPLTVARLHTAQMLGGKKAEAEALVAGFLKGAPNDVVVRGYLAERAMAEQRLDHAEKLYQEIDKIKPDNPSVINNLAWLAGKRKDPQSLALAERAVSLAPGNAAIVDTLGVLQVELGQPEKGVESLRRAVSLAPDAPAIRMNLMRAFAKLGRKDEARKEADLLLQSLPADSPSRAEIIALKDTL